MLRQRRHGLCNQQLILYKIEFLGQVGSVTSRKMTSIAHSKNINKFITDFLSEHGSEELVEMWNEEDNMKAFTALLVKAANAVKRSSDKKIKDPNKPKGKKSAYIIFCTKKREEAKKLLNPDAKATEVTSKLGQMWNELKNSKKTADKKVLQLCEQEAAEDKARYDEDMKDYVPPSDDELIASNSKGKGKGKKKSDPNAPKGKKSAYIFFCSDNRDAAKTEIGADGKATDVTKLLATWWNELKTDEDRSDELEKYTKMAAQDKARHDQETQEYAPSSDGEQVVVAKKKSGGKKKSDPNAPKGKKSAYIFFCSENRDAAKTEIGADGKATDVTKLLSTWWNELKADEDRSDELEKYTKMAADDKIRYEQETNGVEEMPETKKVKSKKSKAPNDEDKSDEEPEPKKGKSKKGKSEDKPQSGKKMNGYTNFCSSNRASVKEDNPEMSATEITKELARQWKELDEDEQNEWK